MTKGVFTLAARLTPESSSSDECEHQPKRRSGPRSDVLRHDSPTVPDCVAVTFDRFWSKTTRTVLKRTPLCGFLVYYLCTIVLDFGAETP